jgi:hypothetical protein
MVARITADTGDPARATVLIGFLRYEYWVNPHRPANKRQSISMPLDTP